MAIKAFVVMIGSFIVGKDVIRPVSVTKNVEKSTIQLEESDVKEMDPQGTNLVPLDEWVIQAKAKAELDELIAKKAAAVAEVEKKHADELEKKKASPKK